MEKCLEDPEKLGSLFVKHVSTEALFIFSSVLSYLVIGLSDERRTHWQFTEMLILRMKSNRTVSAGWNSNPPLLFYMRTFCFPSHLARVGCLAHKQAKMVRRGPEPDQQQEHLETSLGKEVLVQIVMYLDVQRV